MLMGMDRQEAVDSQLGGAGTSHRIANIRIKGSLDLRVGRAACGEVTARGQAQG